jgi:uncharacterized protein (TIRG00374 family)
MRRWQGLLIGFVISIAALYFAVRGVKITDALKALAGANYAWVAPTVFIVIAALFTRAIRWRVLLGGRIPLARSFSILNISYIANNILPARLGEVARAFLAARVTPPIPVFTSLSTILAERIIDMLMVVVMLGGVLLTLPNMPREVSGVGTAMGLAALAVFVALMVLARRRGWAHALLKLFLRALPPLRKLGLPGALDRVLDGLQPLTEWRGLFRIAVWTVISWALSVVAAYVLMYTLFDYPRWDAAILLVAAASLAIAVPATVASVGPFEYAVLISLVAVYGVNVQGLPTGSAVSPLAQDPAAIARLTAVQATSLSYALILHAMNVAIYAFMGAIGLIQEGVSLGQVARGARAVSAEQAVTGG